MHPRRSDPLDLVRHLSSAVRNTDGSFIADCPVCGGQESLWATISIISCNNDCPKEAIIAAIEQEMRTATSGASTRQIGSGMITLSQVEPESVEWLWSRRIPRGKVTIIDGDPGLGKSTLSLDIAARLSVGSCMPGEHERVSRGSTLLLSAEDGLADTIKPRLIAAGADTSRIHALQGIPEGQRLRPPSLPEDIGFVTGMIQEYNISLLIIDPLMAFLSSGVNSFRDQDVRRALAPLASMADETGVAVLILRHLNKMGSGSAMYRGGGSIGISGAARSVLLVAKHPEDDMKRVLASVKNNLAPAPPSLCFSLISANEDSAARIDWWDGETPISADMLLASQIAPTDRSAIDEAGDWLQDFLSDGPIESAALLKEARNQGINEKTLRRAKERLGVEKRRIGGIGGNGHWEWYRPGTPDPPIVEGGS